MPYTTPPPMSASTLLGATQMNIVANDIIDIEGRCSAPNVPFETFDTGDNNSNSPEAKYYMIHKYSEGANLALDYWVEVTNNGGGSGSVYTDMKVNGTTACTFGSATGKVVFKGQKDLSSLADSDGVCYPIDFYVNDSSGGNDNHTDILFLCQLKTASASYASFSASRFRDGDTASVPTDLAAMRTNLMALNLAAKRGVAGFRAREVDLNYSPTTKTLFTGYLDTTRAGGLYVVAGFAMDNSDNAGRLHFKITYNGSSIGPLSFRTWNWVSRSRPTMSACTYDISAGDYTAGDKIPVTVTACSDAVVGKIMARLFYLAEVPYGTPTGYVTPGTFTAGSPVLGNAASPSASTQWLSLAASNIEHLAGDTGRAGYGTDGVSASSKPTGQARAVYSFPVHAAGRQQATGPYKKFDLEGTSPGTGVPVQQIYSIHVGDTGFYRAKECTLKYPAVNASPNTHEVEDYSGSARYDTFNLNTVGGLARGMLYMTETKLPESGATPEDAQSITIHNDFLEERYS